MREFAADTPEKALERQFAAENPEAHERVTDFSPGNGGSIRSDRVCRAAQRAQVAKVNRDQLSSFGHAVTQLSHAAMTSSVFHTAQVVKLFACLLS
jgi:hypothetical protein